MLNKYYILSLSFFSLFLFYLLYKHTHTHLSPFFLFPLNVKNLDNKTTFIACLHVDIAAVETYKMAVGWANSYFKDPTILCHTYILGFHFNTVNYLCAKCQRNICHQFPVVRYLITHLYINHANSSYNYNCQCNKKTSSFKWDQISL